MAIAAALQHGTDIVRDQAELAGSWPATATILFASYTHGSLNRLRTGEDIDSILANHERLGPILARAETVCVELGYADNPEQVVALFEKVNALAEDIRQRRDYHFDEIPTGFEVALIGMLLGIAKQGVDRMPKLVPVDTFAESSVHHALDTAWSPATPLEERCAIFSQVNRTREGTVLRQAHDIAVDTAVDDQEHLIVFVGGSQHKGLAPAAVALGARAESIVLDPPEQGLSDQLTDRMRYEGVEAITREEIEDYTLARDIALAVVRYTGQTENPHLLSYRQASELGLLTDAVGLFCLRGLHHELGETDQQLFDDLVAAIPDQNMSQLAQLAQRLIDSVSKTRRPFNY